MRGSGVIYRGLTLITQAMVKNIRIGLIGNGSWGRNYLDSAKNILGMEIIDITNEIKKSFNKGNIYRTLKDFYHNKNISGFILATLPVVQTKILYEILSIKAPVICEKPLCLYYEDLMYLKEKVQPNHIIFLNHFHLFLETFSFVEKNIHDEEISKICVQDGNCGPFRKDTPSFLDWGVHAVGIVLRLINKAPIKIKYNEVEQSKIVGSKAYVYSLKFRFGDGRNCTVIFGNGFSNKKRTIKVFLKNQIKPIVFLGNNISGVIKHKYADFTNLQNKRTPLENLLIDFRECIQKNKTDPKNSFNLGTRALETLLRIKQEQKDKKHTVSSKYICIDLE